MSPYAIDATTGCWVWRGGRQDGYGTATYAMREAGYRLAHRWYYAERYGRCPPTLDHLCRNRACVNPEHMEPCGRGENVRRGDVAILDWDKVAEMRQAARFIRGSQREKARQLAPFYGVAVQTVRQVLRGVRWPESERPEERAA